MDGLHGQCAEPIPKRGQQYRQGGGLVDHRHPARGLGDACGEAGPVVEQVGVHGMGGLLQGVAGPCAAVGIVKRRIGQHDVETVGCDRNRFSSPRGDVAVHDADTVLETVPGHVLACEPDEFCFALDQHDPSIGATHGHTQPHRADAGSAVDDIGLPSRLEVDRGREQDRIDTGSVALVWLTYAEHISQEGVVRRR